MKNKYFSTLCTLLLFVTFSKISAQCSNFSNVPYYEGFQSITFNNQLPTCWAASNPSITCLTNASPVYNAAFYYSPAATNYFYTSAIVLSPGITYSVSLFAKTSTSSNSNWSLLAIMIGTNQSISGLNTLTSTPGSSLTANYTALSTTFTVPTGGVYYVAIKGAGGGVSNQAQYLYFDDLSITIPCSLNTSSVSLSASANTLCSGSTLSLTAAGANTYTWNTGSNASVLTATPSGNTTYQVTGTNTLTNCTNTASVTVQVKPSPVFSAIASALDICKGNSVTFSTLGSNLTYTWNFGSNAPTVTLTPSVTTTYSVIATNSVGCSSAYTLTVVVHQLPAIIGSATNYTLCENENTVLTASGALTYTWALPGGGVSTSYSVSINPTVSANYVVTGKDANSCVNNATVILTVNLCAGLTKNDAINQSIGIFPNPTQGEFTIDSYGKTLDLLQLFDVNGKLIYESNASAASYNFTSLSPGIYLLKASSGSAVYSCKLVKE